MGTAPPITSYPPFHQIARRVLLPAFGPKVIAALEPQIRSLCRSLLDGLEGRSEFDAATEYAGHVPPDVIARRLGLPLEDSDLFRDSVHGTLKNVAASEEERHAFFPRFNAYTDAQIAAHIAEPKGDLIDFLLNVDIMGSKLLPEHIR